MHYYQFSNKQDLKIWSETKVCFRTVWWRKNPLKLLSVMSIKGRPGSLGSGKGMRAELPERSFPWEITPKHNAGKNQRQKWIVRGGCAGAPRPQGGTGLILGRGSAQCLHHSWFPLPPAVCPCCPWTPRQQQNLSPSCLSGVKGEGRPPIPESRWARVI